MSTVRTHVLVCLCPCVSHFICIASVDSAVESVPGWANLVKGVQCYELFGGITH